MRKGQVAVDQEPKWAAVFQAMAAGIDPVMVVDAKGHVLRMSSPVGSVRPSDAVEGPIWERSPTCREWFRAAIAHAISPGLPQSLEVDMPSGDDRRWYRVHAIPFKGAPDVCVLQWTDTDAGHRNVERLRNNESMMQDAEGLAHLGTWYWDITKPHAEWSPELYQIYGLDPKTHHPTYEDYLGRIHPDDRQRVKDATESVFNDLTTYSHDERILHTDGAWRYLHTWARPVLNGDGSLRALQGVCLDVTARKEAEMALAKAEARQRLILETAGFGIASIALDGTIQQSNPRFDILTGHGNRLQARVQNGRAVEDALAAVANGAPCRATVNVGKFRKVGLLFTLADQEDEPFVVVVARDVSAEAMAHEADARIRRLEARRESQARIVGVAGHELKNPLTPIIVELAMLERGHLGELDERQKRAVAKIQRQVERMKTLLQDLLDASKAEAGQLELTRTDCDVADLVRSAAHSHQTMAAEFGVRLFVEAPTSLMASVDVGRMIQVVDNLVVNALRFTPPGKMVNVTVNEGANWSVVVEDEGVGIPAEIQEDVFDAYVTGSHAAPHKLASNGLGLFVVRAIVEAHGGTIEMQSSPGEGTTITVTFPKGAAASKRRSS